MKPSTEDAAVYPDLSRYLKTRLAEASLIPEDRWMVLEQVAAYVAERVGSGEPSRLTFICTHNARRSQMAQIWAQTAARFFSVPGVYAFSGGTEVSAFEPPAVSAMVRAGFRIERRSKEGNPVHEDNPIYLVRAGNEIAPIRAFSKTYADPSNPRQDFCAVMTCSSADRECPFIPGSDRRVLIPYDDPKSADGTEGETDVYDERCLEICREMGWVFTRAAGA